MNKRFQLTTLILAVAATGATARILVLRSVEPDDTAITVSPTDSAIYCPPTLSTPDRIVHRIEADVLPSTIIHTNDFLNGNNPERRTMNHASTAKLKYAFMPPEGSQKAHIYRGVYQGIGVAWHEFNPQLGNPISVYMFQGARIASLSRLLTFNYEWNLGLTMGWNPYNYDTNRDNRVIGSKVTAYIDADFYLAYRLSRYADINAGVSLSHFSNGNTQFPNAGLNTIGIRLGMVCYIGRSPIGKEKTTEKPIPEFIRRITYDLVLYGAWRRRGVYIGQDTYALPGSYAVMGFNFNPMYNINHWLNAGVSLDGVYDRSANLYMEDHITDIGGSDNSLDYYRAPRPINQMALGLSARAEFVMPYFTINIGIGTNVINAKGDLRGLYEIMALKLNVTRRLFMHIGYSIDDFKNPNHLMLGLGWRFGNVRK